MTDGVYIGGYRTVEDRETYSVRNPADTSDIVATYPYLGREDVREAIDAAQSAFHKWSEMTPLERANILYRTAEILGFKEEQLTQVLTREEGKTIPDSMFEVRRTENLLRFYAGAITMKSGKVIPSQDGKTSISTIREPIGVVGVITPWNFPLSLPAWKIIPAIAAGNAVVWKPASITPKTSSEFVRVFGEAGLPDGVLNMVIGRAGMIGEEIISSRHVDAITFTGSLAVGRDISSRVASSGRFTRLQLELGGKNATVVTAHADLDSAADQVARSAFGLTGQACTATSRVIVHSSIHDRFLQKLKQRTLRMKIGNGVSRDVNIGPLDGEEQYEKVLNYVKIGRNEGARLVMGGHAIKEGDLRRGYFVENTVFDDVSPDMTIAKEEIFGPVLSVINYGMLDEAINMVNSVEYGLVANIVTSNISEAFEFAKRAECGVVKINKATIGLEPWVPYGGFKNSGNDLFKEMGEEGLDFFTRTKAIYLGY